MEIPIYPPTPAIKALVIQDQIGLMKNIFGIYFLIMDQNGVHHLFGIKITAKRIDIGCPGNFQAALRSYMDNRIVCRWVLETKYHQQKWRNDIQNLVHFLRL